MTGRAGWSRTARTLHWLVAGLVLFQLGLGLRIVAFTPDLGQRFDLTQTHKSWGAAILALALLRIGWRLRAGRPPALGPAWRRRLAAGVHVALYALLLWMPLSGWALVSASPLQDLLGVPNTVFGLTPLPDPWTPGDARVEALARAAHLWGAVTMAALIAVHVAGALRGALAERDGSLRRMIRG